MTEFDKFKLIIQCPFDEICTLEKELTTSNDYVLSVLNDFEDGKWNQNRFLEYVWDNLIYTALSQNEREACCNSPHTILKRASANLRITEEDNKVGEIAEILLYGIMRDYYHALPVVPKIFYKQNVNDPAKGADSVHIVLDDTNLGFSLWLGEAKFYNEISNSRLSVVVDSVHDTIMADKIKKEDKIITNLHELDFILKDNIELTNKIKSFLNDDNSIDTIRPILHVPILLLHECEITNDTKHLDKEYKDKMFKFYVDRANAYFKQQIKKCADVDLYENITFHLILFPVANKSNIIEKFKNGAIFYRAQ